jgi:uncharacterized protein (TIGR00661 family)
MRLLFTVQGEGRGHLTQALTVYRNLSQRGHELVGVVVGSPGHRELPDFFTSALLVPVVTLPSPGFVTRGNRSLDIPATLWRSALKLGVTRASVRRLRAIVEETKPDLILNFFEPLTGLAQLFRPLPRPVVSVAHQFMFEHPEYRWPAAVGWQRLGLRLFVGLVGWRSWKLALSLEPAPERHDRRLVVSPPLLRPELFSLDARDGGYYLVYLVNHGYAEDIRAWLGCHPEVVVHCFYDRPGAPEAEVASPNLTFHRLNGPKFLEMMARCKAVVCTAGFESVSEAAWLDKGVFLVPVEGHVEQMLNAFEAARLGFGVTDPGFNLDRLEELPAKVDNREFRAWVSRAGERLDRVLALATSG